MDTGRPSLVAGTNLMDFAAAIARSVKPSGKPDTAWMFVTVPPDEKTARRTTVPVI